MTIQVQERARTCNRNLCCRSRGQNNGTGFCYIEPILTALNPASHRPARRKHAGTFEELRQWVLLVFSSQDQALRQKVSGHRHNVRAGNYRRSYKNQRHKTGRQAWAGVQVLNLHGGLPSCSWHQVEQHHACMDKYRHFCNSLIQNTNI